MLLDDIMIRLGTLGLFDLAYSSMYGLSAFEYIHLRGGLTQRNREENIGELETRLLCSLFQFRSREARRRKAL